MRVGKSGAVRCDHCGEVVVGKPNSFTVGDKEWHFCQGPCMEEHFRERYNDYIVAEVEKRVREEYNFLHKQVCPACKYRLRTKTQ